MKIYLKKNNEIFDNISFNNCHTNIYYYTRNGIYYFDQNKLYCKDIIPLNDNYIYEDNEFIVDLSKEKIFDAFYIPMNHFKCKETFYTFKLNEYLTLFKYEYNGEQTFYFECDNKYDIPIILKILKDFSS